MHVAMWAPLLPLLQALLLARASAEASGGDAEHYLEQQHRTRFSRNEPISCQAEGRLFSEGAVVSAHDPCLRCKCDRGALSCRRLACSTPPGPPPPHCYLAHREGACCPELQCHDAVADVGRTGFAGEDVYPEEKPSSHVFPVCVEGGTAYGAGSAMGTRTACELCFCLGGERRCVRPRCLPAPPGCRARAAPGACCPHSYRCDHDGTGPLDDSHLHDCNVGGKWVAEGERTSSPEAGDDCAQCYCLRGKVRCQSLSCAPPLMGCKALLEPGQCCPHQYQCTHQKRPGLSGFHLQARLDDAPVSIRNQDRSFRNAPASVTLPPPLKDTTTVLANLVTEKTSPIVSADQQESIATTKVKRKTSDSPAKTRNPNPVKHVTTTDSPKTFKAAGTTAATAAPATDGTTMEQNATEPPDSSVRIIINGTINCTTELSSTTFTMNFTNEDEIPGQAATEDAQARVPSVPPAAQPHTYNPNDIITDRNYNGDFDEDESYAINVTSSLVSSLRTNSTSPAASSLAAHEAAKGTSEGYQYKYSKPTLPPSLPNLKIIPFVAADAVVDDEMSSKEALMYPAPESEDKYPVYYPSVEAKDVPFATRREDSYLPTQFPVFLSKKVDPPQYLPQYPLAGHRLDLADEYPSYPGHGDIITALREFTLAATLGNNPPPVNRASSTLPGHGTKFELATPADSLFSPPAETEGGFVPKDPGIIEDYFAPYPSTPPGSIVPHLTTSMQLDTTKECRSEDGRRVLEGESISVACSTCICSWGELHCSRGACSLHHPRPAGCARAFANGCCGELVCASVNESTPTPPSLTTRSVQVSLNTTEKPVAIINSVEESNVLKSTSTAFLAIVPSEVKINYNYSKVSDNTTLETAMSDVKTHATESSVPNKLTTADEQVDAYSNSSQEYADEDDDEGFSFGTVLKLLLSESYETTTSAPLKQFLLPATKLPAPPPAPAPAPITMPTPTTKTQSFKPVTTAAALSSRIPYTSEKKHNLQNTINRIDHLILGEATAIKMTTPRPVTVHFEPTATKKSPLGKLATTHKAMTSARPFEETKTPDFGEHKSASQQRPAPAAQGSAAGLGPGLLKLAGCNIYGQMYRVGRIIAELSTPCQECRCTELGVQCRQLGC